jgi:hypothetical protein
VQWRAEEQWPAQSQLLDHWLQPFDSLCLGTPQVNLLANLNGLAMLSLAAEVMTALPASALARASSVAEAMLVLAWSASYCPLRVFLGQQPAPAAVVQLPTDPAGYEATAMCR